MIRTLGALVGVADKAEGLTRRYEVHLCEVATLVRGRPKPKVYFEEWDDPLISGIDWVSELIEIAGGKEAFPELRKQMAAKNRIVSPGDVIAAANLIEHNRANSKEDFVDVDELDGRKLLLEFEEPVPSLILSSPTRGYRDVNIDGHKGLRRRTAWVDDGQRRASISAAPSKAR
jgi:hypothetical protein